MDLKNMSSKPAGLRSNQENLGANLPTVKRK